MSRVPVQRGGRGGEVGGVRVRGNRASVKLTDKRFLTWRPGRRPCFDTVQDSLRRSEPNVLLLGHLADALSSKATYLFVRRRKRNITNIAVGTVQLFIEPSARHLQLLTHSLYITEIARIRCYTMLCTMFKCQDVQQTLSYALGSDE